MTAARTNGTLKGVKYRFFGHCPGHSSTHLGDHLQGWSRMYMSLKQTWAALTFPWSFDVFWLLGVLTRGRSSKAVTTAMTHNLGLTPWKDRAFSQGHSGKTAIGGTKNLCSIVSCSIHKSFAGMSGSPSPVLPRKACFMTRDAAWYFSENGMWPVCVALLCWRNGTSFFVDFTLKGPKGRVHHSPSYPDNSRDSRTESPWRVLILKGQKEIKSAILSEHVRTADFGAIRIYYIDIYRHI